VLNALRSIALQLRTCTGNIPVRVQEIYEKEIDRHSYELYDLETAAQVIEAFTQQNPRVHIIVDGLDECQDLKLALRMFSRLATTFTCGIAKWFFISRKDSAIEAAMTDVIHATVITAPPGAIMNDIINFLDHNNDKLLQHKCNDYIQYWTAASGENFLYSKLMLDVLSGEGVTCNEEMYQELRKFPSGLTGCYMRCLDSLTNRSQLECSLAR
jgi:hypothetical protein